MNPCDVYSDEGEIFLLSGKRLEVINEQAEPSRDTFIKSLIALEPSFEYIFREMPHSEEDHRNIADLIVQESLVVGSNDGYDQNGRIVCAIILASEDLLDYHISGHEVFGEPKDSGRVEMMGVTAIILYLCQIIIWHDLPRNTNVKIYSDSAETVRYTNGLWMGETPKWADARNAEIKRTIRQML